MTIMVNMIIIDTIIINKKQFEFWHAKASDPGVALSLAGRYQHKHFQ
jgi:hypothetical protein